MPASWTEWPARAGHTRATVNACKRGQRDAEKIKRRNRSVGKREACRSDCFITPWARPNSFVAIHDATAAAKSPKKFHVFHERHVWKSTSVNKRTSPAENSVIAASHPQYEPCVMRKAVRQPVYDRRGRQADPKETATHFGLRIIRPISFKDSSGTSASACKNHKISPPAALAPTFICLARLRAPLRIT